MKVSEKSNQEIIEQLIRIANNFNSTKENYLFSYPYFLSYFKNLQTINLENLIIGISFTYSWMPRILTFNPKIKNEVQENTNELLEKAIIILNDVKNGKLIDRKELLVLKKLFNNSLVGTSKLLHFINPEQYAIWDSRVFRFLNNEEPHKYKLEKPKDYLKYIEFIEKLKNDKNFETFYKLMKQKVDDEITEYRALELAFFKGE